MNPFTSLIRTLLEADDFWVRRAPIIELTEKDKRRFGLPPTHHPHIDLLAYDCELPNLFAIQVVPAVDKGAGLTLDDIGKETVRPAGDFPMLTSAPYRELVLKRLEEQLFVDGIVYQNTDFGFGLVLGNVRTDQLTSMHNYIVHRTWLYWSQVSIRENIKALHDNGEGDEIEGSAAALAARFLLPGK